MIERALRALARRRAVLVGDLMLDAYLYGETLRVSREAPVLVVRQEHTEYRLGGAANTAANLAALGVHTQVFGRVGDDSAGKTLQALLGATGADVQQVRQEAGKTPSKMRVLAGASGTGRQQILRLDDEPPGNLASHAASSFAEALVDAARQADVVVVSDYGLGLVQGPVLQAILQLAGDKVPVCVDSRFALQHFRGVAVVTPNLPEAEAEVGFAIADAAAVHRAGAHLLGKLECDACLMTQGRQGMTLFCRGEEPCHVDIVGKGEVTDVTGAGDTVTATVGAALAAGIGLTNGMKLANCAAGIVVNKMGTATASPDEIVQRARAGCVELASWD